MSVDYRTLRVGAMYLGKTDGIRQITAIQGCYLQWERMGTHTKRRWFTSTCWAWTFGEWATKVVPYTACPTCGTPR